MVETVLCDWCRQPVELLPQGWKPGRAAYCTAHRAIAGRNPWGVGQQAIADAVDLQESETSGMLRWPWQAVHDLAGILVPRRVYYVAAFSANGKTTFLAECFASWLEAGHRVTYLPLESDPSETMARVACARVGVSADEALSMRLRERAERGDTLARDQWDRLRAMFDTMRQDTEFLYQFRIDPTSTLSPDKFRKVVESVKAMESDILLVDHVDHVEGDANDNSPEIKISNGIQQAALNAARELNIPVVLATQLNSRAAGGDRLAHYRPPIMDWLWNKGKKEHIASVCLGLYRPMDAEKTEAIAKVRAGFAEPHTVAKPERMGVAGMKLRFGGDRKERTVELQYRHGKLTDLPPAEAWADESSTHGIRTSWEER